MGTNQSVLLRALCLVLQLMQQIYAHC